MRNAENAADVRLLTDTELEDVNGGVWQAVPGAIFFCLAMGIGYADFPLGASVEQAAAALGAEHLL